MSQEASATIGGRHRRSLAKVVCAVIAAALLPTLALAAPLQVAMMQGAQSCVALTFDDGPDVTLTPKLLSILESKGVKATFFVVGYRAQSFPDAVLRANNDGDEIGNHSWDHPVLPSLASDAALRELTRTDDAIQKIIGHVPAYTRAPYGSMSSRIGGLSPRTFVAWNVDTLDWRYPDVARITSVAVSKAVNGSIILMHDVHPRTIDAVPGVIEGLQARGFRLVTISELLGGDCGGHAIGFDLPGEGPLGGTNSNPLTSSLSPKAPASPKAAPASPAAIAAAPVQQAATRPPFKLYDDDNN